MEQQLALPLINRRIRINYLCHNRQCRIGRLSCTLEQMQNIDINVFSVI